MKLVYFSKKNCAPCNVSRPIVETVAELERLPVEHIDCSPGRSAETEALISKHNLRSVPALLVVGNDGEVLATLTGAAITSQAIRNAIPLQPDARSAGDYLMGPGGSDFPNY